MTRVCFLLALAACLRAQSVQGVVLDSVTGKPVAGVVVLLSTLDSEAPDLYRARSDAAGRFRFARVIPGVYRANAEAPGFLRPAQRAPHITVNPSPGTQELTIPLTPAGVISGRVTDQDGDPIAYASVEAMQYTYQSGKKALRSISNERTNDRGEYRLFNLQPGRYYVRAVLRSGGTAPTFFPGTYDVAQATPLDALPGAELRSTDILLRQESVHSIAGRVLDSTGQPAANAYVIARSRSGAFSNGGPQLVDSFTIAGLVPGQYILTAQQFTGSAQKTATQLVDLGAADLTGVTLTLRSGFDLAGTVSDLPDDSHAVHFSIEPDDPSGRTYRASPTPKGAFFFSNVWPDRYHLLWNLPKGVYVKSIRFGDRRLPDDRLDLTGAVAPLSIQLAADGGRVQGTVRNAAGQPVPEAVVTLSADPAYDFWSAIADDAGHFEIRDIAPGTYSLLAFDGAPSGAPQDPDYRKPYQKSAKKLEVLPSTQQTIDLIAITPQ